MYDHFDFNQILHKVEPISFMGLRQPHIKQIKPQLFAMLDLQFGYIAPDAMAVLSTEQITAVSPKAFSTINFDSIKAISIPNLQHLTVEQLNNLTTIHINSLTCNQILQFTTHQKTSLIPQLSNSYVKRLSFCNNHTSEYTTSGTESTLMPTTAEDDKNFVLDSELFIVIGLIIAGLFIIAIIFIIASLIKNKKKDIKLTEF